MATQSSGNILSHGSTTIYRGISTVTYTTIVSVSGLIAPGDITTIYWPSPTTRAAVEYTSASIPLDPASKYFPDPLPIFIATEIDEVFVNGAGKPITTIIQVQAQPAYVYGVPTVGDTGANCIGSNFTCWGAGKKAVIIILIVLGGLLVIVFLVRFCYFMRNSRSPMSDEENQYGTATRDQEQNFARDRAGRRKRLRRSNSESAARSGRNRNRRRPAPLSSYTELPKPLPRIVMTHSREDRRFSSTNQNALSSNNSSGSSGRAVVGVGKRDTHKEGVEFGAADDIFAMADRRAMRAATIAMDPKTSTITKKPTVPKMMPRSDSAPYTPQRASRRNSRPQEIAGPQERGRSPVRKSSSRRRLRRIRSNSPPHRLGSALTENRNSFAPYAPVAVAVLEDLWERIEQNTPRSAQRSRSVFSAERRARSHRRSGRDHRRASRHHRDNSPFEPPQSRSVHQDFAMSGGRGESPAGSPIPLPRKPSRRRLSNHI